MNAVQSFWITDDSIRNGGWVNKRFECISWSLSYFLLRRKFRNIHLYCNSAGYQLLIEELGLQYDKIYKDLDGKEALIRKSWGLGKMQTHASQEAPFVHLDGDVFWFDIPDDDFFETDVFAQNIEMDEPMYRNVRLSFEKYGIYFPDFLRLSNKAALAANTGIIGGTNLKFFKELFDEAVIFLEKNQTIIEQHSEDFKFISIYTEQSFFVSLINHLNIKIKFLKKPVFRSNFYEVLNFNRISATSKTPGFIHLLGSSRYRLLYCNLIEFWLHRLWPEQLEKINDLYPESGRTKSGFTNFLNPQNEKKLPDIKWLFDKPQEVLNHPFARTETIFGLSMKDYSADQILNHPDFERLKDCMTFERRRVQVLLELMSYTTPELMYSHFESHLAFCSKSYQEITPLKFVLNASKTLKSTFNWFNELKYNAGNYWYNLMIDSQQVCFQEFLMTEFECQILELFKEVMTITDLNLAWSTLYQQENNQKTGMIIHETLKELISNDLVRIC